MSYLIKTGSLDSFSVRPPAETEVSGSVKGLLQKHTHALHSIKSYAALEQMKRSLAAEKIPLPLAGKRGGNSLKFPTSMFSALETLYHKPLVRKRGAAKTENRNSQKKCNI